jgi:hypothetical protein
MSLNVAVAQERGAKDETMRHRANYAQQLPELPKKFTELLATLESAIEEVDAKFGLEKADLN